MIPLVGHTLTRGVAGEPSSQVSRQGRVAAVKLTVVRDYAATLASVPFFARGGNVSSMRKGEAAGRQAAARCLCATKSYLL